MIDTFNNEIIFYSLSDVVGSNNITMIVLMS